MGWRDNPIVLLDQMPFVLIPLLSFVRGQRSEVRYKTGSIGKGRVNRQERKGLGKKEKGKRGGYAALGWEASRLKGD
jgi:hypothetical protein